MIEIESGSMWIGNASDARNPRSLFDCEIAAVMELAWDEPAAQLPREIIYCRFPLVDGDGNSTEILTLAVRTLVELYSCGIRTLVACSAGMSRSPAVLAAALSVIRNEDADAVLGKIGQRRSLEVSPPLWEQLIAILPAVHRPSQ